MPWLLEASTTLSDRLIRSCARQRFVAASSRRTEEKVASRRGSGKHWRRASRARALSLSLRYMSLAGASLKDQERGLTEESSGQHALAVARSAVPPIE